MIDKRSFALDLFLVAFLSKRVQPYVVLADCDTG
jgi:hypothetical protein